MDNAADDLFLVYIEDHDIEQAVVKADMFAADVLFQIQRSGKQVGKADKVAQVGAVQIVTVVNFAVFFFGPESFDKLVIVFDNAEVAVGDHNRRRNAAQQGVGLALSLLFHVGNAHFRFRFAGQHRFGKIATGVVTAAAAV